MSDLERRYVQGDGWKTVEAPSQTGVAVTYEVPFTFETPNLANGIVIYRPAVGDRLMDAWMEVDEAFDGTTPCYDIGTFDGVTTGLFFFASTYRPSLEWPASSDAGSGLVIPANWRVTSLMGLAYTTFSGEYSGSYVTVPARFVSGNPLKLVASQNGEIGGDPLDSTQGSARICFTIVRPTTP